MVRTIWRPSSIRRDESTPRHQGVLSAARSMLTSGRGGRGPALSSSIRHPQSTIDSNASNPLLLNAESGILLSIVASPPSNRCVRDWNRQDYAQTKTILLLSCQVIAEHLPSAASASCFSSIPNPEAEPSPAVSTKRKARRRSLDKATIDNIPSLAESEFMHRSKVLKQYRSFVRLAIFLDEQNGGTGECSAV